MADPVKSTNNPKITDTVEFELLTPDANGCFLNNPFRVDNVKIFFVSRDFSSGNVLSFQELTIDAAKEKAAAESEARACVNPSLSNIEEAKRLRAEATNEAIASTIYFRESKTVAVFGDGSNPAWLSTDTSEALIENISTDADGNAQYGVFKLIWEPLAQREGDYFICWTWTPNPAGSSLSSNMKFALSGDTQETTAIPTHFTVPNKYETLLENYLPETYKMKLSANDLTPTILENFNNAVAKGFTVLEDLANQISDLSDANATHEAFLPLLSNTLGLKLKSSDPTLWRRQIKQAVPLYKRKGTKGGLEEAFAQAGMSLNKCTPLWQVISPYTYQEAFIYSNSNNFTLSEVALPLDLDNFELALRLNGEDTETLLSSDYVTFDTVDGVTTMTWVGETLSINPIELEEGDVLRVIYLINPVPGPTEQAIEDFIRTLSLADQRDFLSQDYPLKNWNVRVIEEDDPLFDIVITTRHPFVDPLVFGKVRTEFPYSENIYNMEEYSGSLRNSKLPCDIDKDFLDPCKSCRSSKFTIDIEIEELTNDRINEAQEIIREFTPFHAVLHSMNFIGSWNEFIPPPVEEVEMLVTYKLTENVISGNAQFIQNRSRGEMDILRSFLSQSETVVDALTGTLYNDYIVLNCAEVNFLRLGLDISTNKLEILAPSANSGSYTVSQPTKNTVVIETGISEPINKADFTFRLSNIMFSSTSTDVAQDDYFRFTDNEIVFSEFGVKSDFDVETDSDYTGGAWKIDIPVYSAMPFTIANVLPDGSLVLNDPSESLPTSNVSDISYTLLDDSDSPIANSDLGNLIVSRRGRVTLNDTGVDVQAAFEIEFYIEISSTQYQIIGFVDDSTTSFYITGWTGGDVTGTTSDILKRLVDNQIGFVDYSGTKLIAAADHESGLSINNGTNPPASEDDILEDSHFKENYLVFLGEPSGGFYYAISEIDGTLITLAGPKEDFTTLSAGGKSQSYSIIRYINNPITIDGTDFDFIDRRGKELVTYSTETALMKMALNNQYHKKDGNDMFEWITQDEGISYQIEWKDGSKEKGDI